MHKILLKLLTTQLFFLFVIVTQLVFPSNSYASALIGTHLGEGDVRYQVNIINTVLVPNGLEPESPVTVMVPVTNLQSSQRDGVEALASAVYGAGFFPIIRINGVCEDFETETGLTAASAVDAARAIFPTGLIVWGNEVNNKEKECRNWEKYVQDYNQIRNKTDVSPAALDYYMGLEAYSVTTMFQTPGMAEIFSTAPRAANAYGCIGQTAESCEPGATVSQQIGYEAINGIVYLTEFSLSPGGEAPNAPDTNIEKVLEFIATRAGATPAVKVTPLVRNVCNNDSDWLLYVNGKLFTPQGLDVSENCEGRTNSGYDLSLYPDYDVDETKFYLSPIRNLITGGSETERTVEKLRKELAMQGYQSYCAAQGVAIDPEYNTEEKIQKYFSSPEYTGVEVLEVNAIEELTFTNAQYPLWRDVSNKQFLLASLEEYFGFRDVYVADPAAAVLMSSPINSLLSEPQLCVQGWKNLVEQKKACNRLLDEGSCELLTRPIPATDFTVDSLIEKLNEYEPAYQNGTAVKGCTNLINKDRAANAELLKGLINTPTYFDRSYRYGFVVAVVRTKPPGGSLEKIFNFFTQITQTTKPRDEVLVAAFKLPDIGTNKGGGDDTGSHFWSDPLDLTRKLLLRNEQNTIHEDVDRDKHRDNILTNAITNAKQDEGKKIYCYEGEYPNGTGSASCQNELTKAITDLINGNTDGCDNKTEIVQVIKDLAGLDNPAEARGKVFNNDNGGEVMLNLFLGDKTHPSMGGPGQTNPQVARTLDSNEDPANSLKSIFKLSESNWNTRTGGTTVDFYVLYPMGFELEKVEEAIKGAFFSKQQIEQLEKMNTTVGFEMTGQQMGLTAESKGLEFEDVEKTLRGDCGIDESTISGTPANKKCMDELSITVKQESGGVGILGARLGYWMRKVQTQLNAQTSEAWKYFDSCKTTEEFMLGKCAGGNLTGNSGDDEIPLPGDALVAVAQCKCSDDPTVICPRITSGETATHVDTTGTGACTGKLTRLYVPTEHEIANWKNPNDAVVNCADLYSYAACTHTKTLMQNPVNSQGKFVPEGNITACEYVVAEAKRAGISPRFALAMWGEESAFSHYRVADFGVISKPAQDLGAQVASFISTVRSHDTYLAFLEAYSGEERIGYPDITDPSPGQFCNNPNFVGNLKTYYDFLGPR